MIRARNPPTIETGCPITLHATESGPRYPSWASGSLTASASPVRVPSAPDGGPEPRPRARAGGRGVPAPGGGTTRGGDRRQREREGGRPRGDQRDRRRAR